jgi:hypothetical protein
MYVKKCEFIAFSSLWHVDCKQLIKLASPTSTEVISVCAILNNNKKKKERRFGGAQSERDPHTTTTSQEGRFLQNEKPNKDIDWRIFINEIHHTLLLYKEK